MSDTLNLLTRRRFVRFGAGGYLGLDLGGLWRARAGVPAPAARTTIRACILVFYYGGPSHLDTYDPKPNAPDTVRGEFRPVAPSPRQCRGCASASTCRGRRG